MICHLFNLKMVEGASITNHINKFNMIMAQLSSVEIVSEDEVKALILLSSLLESWSTTVTAVSSLLGSTKLKMDDARDFILSEDICRKESGESSGSALSIQNRGRSQRKGQKKDRKDIVCWNCNKKDHFSS